jgi:MoaE-MoaD fusion protein
MSYAVKLFAGLADVIGQRSIQLEAVIPPTVAGLRMTLKTNFPSHSQDIDGALIAVNRTYGSDETLISEQDEIALIPPVGGGAEDFGSCLITESPLRLEEAYTYLDNAHFGGTVLFCGTVREWTDGVQTEYLSYEAYTEMALSQMEKIQTDVTNLWPGVATVQWHRIGRLDPQEIAVICGAAAPHRDAAFQAARMLIERLKKEVPIWKKEAYVSGQTTWQANPS